MPTRTFRPRILVAEDDVVFGLELSLTLQDLDWNVLGPCRTATEARAAIEAHHPDAAVVALDLDPAGQTLAIANELSRSDVPYLLVSRPGEEDADLPHWFAKQPHLRRPIATAALTSHVDALIDE